MVQGGVLVAHRFVRAELDLVPVVDDAIEDGITNPSAPEIFMPVADREL